MMCPIHSSALNTDYADHETINSVKMVETWGFEPQSATEVTSIPIVPTEVRAL